MFDPKAESFVEVDEQIRGTDYNSGVFQDGTDIITLGGFNWPHAPNGLEDLFKYQINRNV